MAQTEGETKPHCQNMLIAKICACLPAWVGEKEFACLMAANQLQMWPSGFEWYDLQFHSPATNGQRTVLEFRNEFLIPSYAVLSDYRESDCIKLLFSACPLPIFIGRPRLFSSSASRKSARRKRTVNLSSYTVSHQILGCTAELFISLNSHLWLAITPNNISCQKLWKSMILKTTSNAYTSNDVSRFSLSQHPDHKSERKILHAHSFYRNTVHSMSQAGWLWNLQMVSVTVKVNRVIFEHEKTSLRLPRTSPTFVERLDCRASDYGCVPPRNVAATRDHSPEFNRQRFSAGEFPMNWRHS